MAELADDSILSDEEMSLQERHNILAALKQANWKPLGESGDLELLEQSRQPWRHKCRSWALRGPFNVRPKWRGSEHFFKVQAL
jgi:hypothetical protein